MRNPNKGPSFDAARIAYTKPAIGRLVQAGMRLNTWAVPKLSPAKSRATRRIGPPPLPIW
jgi:hypothetical protein